MKFKRQGKINTCGFEYKKNIADSRGGGGGSDHPQKKPVSAPGYIWHRMSRETSRLVALVSRYVSSRELSVSLHPYMQIPPPPKHQWHFPLPLYTATNYPSKINISCQSSNLIYLITCSKCGIQYVGQTKNRIIDRFQGHFNDISSGRDTTVASHFNTCTPSDSDKLSNIETTVLDFIKANPHSLTAGKQSDSKEKHWIHQLHTVVPRGLKSGHNLPDKSCVADTAMQIELA